MALEPKQIKGIIETHKKRSHKDHRLWDKYRAWYLSEFWEKEDDLPTGAGEPSDADELTFETNYLYAYLDTMIANVCPTNPQVSVYARREELQESAELRQALINEMFRQNQLHTKLWKACTFAGQTGRGILKTVWDKRKNRPVVRVIDPRYVWWDMSVEWEDTRYLVEVTVLTKGEFKRRIKKSGPGRGQRYSKKVGDKAEFGSYPAWLQDTARDKSMIDQASREVFEWVVVYEFYDFVGEKFYHMLDGCEEPLFEGDLPYRLVRNPFRLITFNDNLSDSGGVPDAKLVEGNIERLNEIDTLELRSAHATIPIMLVDKSKLDNASDFLDMLRDVDGPGMAALAEMINQGVRLQDIIYHTPVPPFSPEFGEMRQRAIDTIEFVLGIPAYSRGKVGVTDVATEAALADTAVRTRNGRRIKSVLDLVSGIGKDIMGLYEEFLPADGNLRLRLTGKSETINISRDSINAMNPDEEDPLDYDYEAVVYSPTENHRLLQLDKFKQFLELFLQHPMVDPEKFMTTLLDLLQIPDILLDEDKRQQAVEALQGAAEPGAGAAPPPGPEPPPMGVAPPPGVDPTNMPPIPGGF